MVASTLPILRVGFVPEHFSSPLHRAVELGYFEREGIIVERMTTKLIDGSLDIAIALTEGLLAGIAKGHDAYKIVGTYVESPLCWAISVGQKSRHTSRATLKNGTIGVSRLGSGSHIIPFVLAEQEGWLEGGALPAGEGYKAPFEFKVLHNFANLRDSVNDNSSDAFLWERFTTKPYHDTNEVRLVDTITPPWPAFMIAASVQHLPATADTDSKNVISKFLSVLSRSTSEFTDPKNYNHSIQYVQDKMSYNKQDVEDWFSGVRYPSEKSGGCAGVQQEALLTCSRVLLEAGVLHKGQDTDAVEEHRPRSAQGQEPELPRVYVPDTNHAQLQPIVLPAHPRLSPPHHQVQDLWQAQRLPPRVASKMIPHNILRQRLNKTLSRS
ncbi:hypothetical protein DFQ26_007061 [Actinomortierella ambigua]|nr:hypothetical protein DFQ26_007061 [Actinomortierella ambigua]